MSKTIDILKAIQNLPAELITPEIYNAGILEGQIEILNVLPPDYLTEENINTVIDQKKYSWSGYDLNRIPENARTTRICEVAVEKKTSNYLDVPKEKRTTNMLKSLVSNAAPLLHYFSEVPLDTWDEESVYTGISSIYRCGESSDYRYRGYSSGSSDKVTQMRLIQIYLYYVPDKFKTMPFYLELFTKTGMDIKHIDFLTPDKFKKHSYYLEVSKKDINAVPIDKLTSAIFKVALLSDKNAVYTFFDNKTGIKEKMFELMDDDMAEIIIKKSPAYLNELPKQFQTKKRLILALEHHTEYRLSNVYCKYDTTKFDTDICKALVKKDRECPQFAETIWTQEFIDFCMENGPSLEWFKQMPTNLQTQEIVDKAIKRSIWNIEYVLSGFISFNIAVEAFRDDKDSVRKHVPLYYLNNFKLETGLPKEIFGGERTYFKLRETREDYTYCILGDSYIGYFVDEDNRNKYSRLIMTRRTPMQIQPSIVFSRVISTYHVTWLEKLVSDNDPKFEKPVVDKGLKGKQINAYIGVRMAETVDGVKIYAHSFLGETIKYTASDDDKYVESKSLAGIKKKLLKEAVC